jgi:hypothetical protein
MRHRLLIFLVLFSLVRALHAQEIWIGNSDVTFKGYSTLHTFTGTIKSVPLKAFVSQGANGRVVSATSAVEVKQMTTQNETRDGNMMQMFNEPQHHFIKLEVVDAQERSLKPGNGAAGTMSVALTIAGRRSPVTGAVTNVAESRDTVSFDLAFPVSLKAFHLDPPKAAAGLVKVQDTIDVSAHVILKRRAQ